MHSIMIVARRGDGIGVDRVAARFRKRLGSENVLIAFDPAHRRGVPRVISEGGI